MGESQMEKIMSKLTDIGERLVKVETLLKERTADTNIIFDTLRQHESRINELEKHRTQVVSVKDILTWVAMFAIAALGVVK